MFEKEEKIFYERNIRESLKHFYDVILYDREIKDDYEKQEVEACYFAMALLMPIGAFLSVIKQYGGLEETYKDYRKIEKIAELFRVEEQLVRCRIKEEIRSENNKKEIYIDDSTVKPKPDVKIKK